MSAIFSEKRAIVFWSPADRLNDRSAVRRSHQLCHEPKQNLHGDYSTSNTQAFYSSSTVNPALLAKNNLKMDSCLMYPYKVSLNLHVNCFSAEGQKDRIMSPSTTQTPSTLSLSLSESLHS